MTAVILVVLATAGAAQASSFQIAASSLPIPPSIVPAPVIHALFWAPVSTPMAPGAETLDDRFLADISVPPRPGSTDAFATVDQYWGSVFGDGTTSVNVGTPDFAGGVDDTAAYPDDCADANARTEPCITDDDIQQQIAAKQRAVPSGPDDVWVVLTPPQVAVCTNAGGTDCNDGSGANSWCGYHEPSFAQGTIYVVVAYKLGNCLPQPSDDQAPNDPAPPLSDPYPGSNDATLVGLEHELAETLTDLDVSGWNDPAPTNPEVNELADYCDTTNTYAPVIGGASGHEYNQVINGDHYWLLELWSDAAPVGPRCVNTFSPPLEASFTATPASVPAGGAISFDGSSSTDTPGSASALANGTGAVNATGTISSYTWSFGDGTGTTTASPTTTHAYAAAGTYEATLTVADAASGQSGGPPITSTIVKTVTVTASQSSGSGPSSPGGTGPTSPSGPSSVTPEPSATVSVAQIRRLLARVLRPHGPAAKRAQVTRKRGYALTFAPPIPGRLTITWSYVPLRRHHVISRQTIAAGRRRFGSARPATVEVRLTAAGRRLLKRLKRIPITVTGSFVPVGGKPIGSTAKLTLR